VVLLNTTLGGGIRPCIKAAAVCETPRIAVAIHSSGELGIQLATMLHMGSVLYDRDPERPGWFALVPNDRWHAVS